MNTDTHFNQGGGGAAYAIRHDDVEIQAGDRIRTLTGASRPVYGTVLQVGPFHQTLRVQLDNGLIRTRDLIDVTFHGRPHAAFNKGGAQ